MSQKLPKPTLSGQRIKTRKRDEKEKYEPSSFRDILVGALNECGDLDKAYKYLDVAGSKLDYHRYGETLFDILITGAILAPGGSLVIDSDVGSCKISVFEYPQDTEQFKEMVQLFNKVIRRYKYLEKSLEDDLKKVIVFLKGFSDEQRQKIAKLTGMLLSNNIVTAKILESLFQDHLVKEGLSVEFAKMVFVSWLQDKDISSVSSALKRNNLDDKLLNFLPTNKRTASNLEEHFKEAGLEQLITFHRSQRSDESKKQIRGTLKRMLEDEISLKDVVLKLKELQEQGNFNESDLIVLIWNTVMNMVEWNKKEDLIGDQALKHMKTHIPLFKAFVSSPKTELSLISRIQEYCYDNMNFMKVFQKIIINLYKGDVLTEDIILKWYNGSHLSKGKTIFLEQMKPFIEWLHSAEEEESDGEEDVGSNQSEISIEAGSPDISPILDGIHEIKIENGAA